MFAREMIGAHSHQLMQRIDADEFETFDELQDAVRGASIVMWEVEETIQPSYRQREDVAYLSTWAGRVYAHWYAHHMRELFEMVAAMEADRSGS